MDSLQRAKEEMEEALQLSSEGKFAESRLLYETIAPVFEAAAAWEDYVDCLNRWSECLWRNAQFDAGKAQASLALQIALEQLGEEHEQVAVSYSNLGACFQGKGDYNRTLDYQQKALKARLELYGERNLDTATCHNNLGNCYYYLGNSNLAIEHHKKALQTRLEILGSKHSDIATGYNNLGNCYNNNGNYDEAVECHQKALQIRVETQGEKHLDTAISYNNLGNCYRGKGEYNRAIEYLKKALQIRLATHGEMHLSTAGSYNNLGNSYSYKGDYDLAIQYAQKALQIRTAIHGEVHPETGLSYNNLGRCYYQKGDYKKSVEYHQKGLQIRMAVLGEKHPDTALSYNNLGEIFRCIGDYDRAIQYYQKALKILLATVGKEHPHIAICYNSVGKYHLFIGNYDQAITYFQKALPICLANYGEQHEATADTYCNLGICNVSNGHYNLAISYFEKALKILTEIFGEQHYRVAGIYSNLGSCYEKMGDDVKSFQCFQKSLAIRLKTLGKKHPDTGTSYNDLGFYHKTQGDYLQALTCFQKALQSNIYKYNNPNIYHNPAPQEYTSAENLCYTFPEKAVTLYKLWETGNNAQNLQAALFTSQVAAMWVSYIRRSFNNEGSKLTLAKQAFSVFKEAVHIAYHAAPVLRANASAWHTATTQIAKINAHSFPPAEFTYCLTEQDCLHTAFNFCEQSRAMVLLSNLQDEEAKGQAFIPQNLLQAEKQLKIELSYYNNKINEETYKASDMRDENRLLELQSLFFDYKQQYDALITQLETDFPDYYELKYRLSTAKVPELQYALAEADAPTVLIAYFVTDTHVYIFALSAHNYRVYELPNVADIKDDVEDFLQFGITNKIKNNYFKLGYKLFLTLLAPVMKDFTPSGNTETNNGIPQNSQLIIIPDDILSGLPFETLLTHAVDDQNSYSDFPYLIMDYDISYHFSATLWLRSWQKKRQADSRIWNQIFTGFAPVYVSGAERERANEGADEVVTTQAFAIPAAATRDIKIGHKNYPALLYSEEEVSNVAHLFTQQNHQSGLYLHEMATVQNFMQQATDSKYILVAAHADFQTSRPELTGIIFSPEDKTPKQATLETEFGKTYQDHILYLSDSYHLRLNADLVVLSCCETGIGKLYSGEGVLALNRGFLYAGAQNIIYTLFKVYDEESSRLTQILFAYILAGKPYRQALKQAKIDMIKKGCVPIYWSGYVLAGA
ncbi:hypothetical protein B6N25_08385 [Sphingobacteriales bacterium TSM_CSS]|nr:hypothetical protein B6N25_08385 [Sphingobacteriales bacterium TSM_CSS]